MMKGGKLWLCLIVSALYAVSLMASPFADADDSDKPTGNFDDLLQSNPHVSLGLSSEAELAVSDQRYERAIELARRALNINDDDLNLHRVYAEALEGKFMAQPMPERDPSLYKECLKEWLVVMHSEAGEERGLNIKGAGGIFDYLYKDDEFYLLARRHLQKLAGTPPRPWETDGRYLKRVLKRAPAVKGDVLKKMP